MNQVEQAGIERIYNYSYNKVFYACEDSIPRMFWIIRESNFDEGYIFIQPEEAPLTNAGIKIKKIDNNKTLIKILEFHSLAKKGFYRDFFSRLDALLNRKQ